MHFSVTCLPLYYMVIELFSKAVQSHLSTRYLDVVLLRQYPHIFKLRRGLSKNCCYEDSYYGVNSTRSLCSHLPKCLDRVHKYMHVVYSEQVVTYMCLCSSNNDIVYSGILIGLKIWSAAYVNRESHFCCGMSSNYVY